MTSRRAEAVQGAQLQVQQAHYPERPGPLLPGRQGQRGPEEQDTGGTSGQHGYGNGNLNGKLCLGF